MVRRNEFEEIGMALIGIFVLIAIISALFPSFGSIITGMFFIMMFFIILAIIIKIIELFRRLF